MKSIGHMTGIGACDIAVDGVVTVSISKPVRISVAALAGVGGGEVDACIFAGVEEADGAPLTAGPGASCRMPTGAV